ncbi:hypothetical protein C8R46DRAFT_473496 [Mycena filopes]|nr:hypothetical protein C8R46DRAFT_473496 [Mycena filopes]
MNCGRKTHPPAQTPVALFAAAPLRDSHDTRRCARPPQLPCPPPRLARTRSPPPTVRPERRLPRPVVPAGHFPPWRTTLSLFHVLLISNWFNGHSPTLRTSRDLCWLQRPLLQSTPAVRSPAFKFDCTVHRHSLRRLDAGAFGPCINGRKNHGVCLGPAVTPLQTVGPERLNSGLVAIARNNDVPSYVLVGHSFQRLPDNIYSHLPIRPNAVVRAANPRPSITGDGASANGRTLGYPEQMDAFTW